MAEAVVSIVVGRLTDLLTEHSQLLHEVTDQIQQVVNELTRMKTFLPDADSRIDEHEVRNLVADVRELAYEAEHVVETFIVKSSSTGKAMQWMNKNKFSRKAMLWMNKNKFSRKKKDIQRRMSPLFDRFRDCNIKSILESPSSSSGAPKTLKRFYSYATPEPPIFVGHQEDVDLLVGHLLNGSDDSYSLIAICGMGGLGKTTLAEKIYNHTSIKTCFAGLAWVTISQKWNSTLVLQRILICLVPEKKNEILTWDDDKLGENLLEIQQRKKCLIVLDDIWSTDAWDSLKSAFPAENSVSKIMLTSRNDKVAEHANPNGYIHRPELLSPDQSWEVLRLKALPKGGDCLDITRDVKRMEELGRKMVGNCGGLPLAIMLLGGILVTKPSLIEWEKVYIDSLSSLKSGEGLGKKYQGELFDILIRSYNDLPPQLKPCFLYLGKFGEDQWIETDMVYQLWIAEGLVLSCDKREGETMMRVAESYMGELVHKSLVQVRGYGDEGSLIKFESCSLHDIMRDMSLSQAKVEDFYEVIDLRERNDFDENPSRSGYGRQLVVQFEGGYTSGKANSYYVKKPNQERYRSMILLSISEVISLTPVPSSHIANFRFLRVFSLEKVDLERSTKLITVIESLIYLRYLSLSHTNFLTFPSVQKLVLLETLKLNTSDEICFPRWLSGNMLLKLGHLRHLYLPYWRNQKFEKNFKLRFDGLSKLETLANFHTDWCVVEDLPKLINLRMLTITTSGYHVEEIIKYLVEMTLSSYSCLRYLGLTIDSGDLDLAFPDGPDTLRQLLWNQNFNLQELAIDGQLPEMAQIFDQQLNNSLPDVSFVHITRLVLGNSFLEEDPMAVLEKIPTLRELGLHYEAYMGKEMVCSAMGFPKLTCLVLWNLPNLVKWRVEEGSMPLLNYLEIGHCYKLKELPEGLRFLNSLDELELCHMPSDFCDRVRVVNGEQGPDFYKVAHVPRLQIYNIRK